MSTDLVTVSLDTKVGETIRLLAKNHFRSIPVVSDEGKLVGQFGVHALLELLVPFGTKIAREGPMTDISFMHDGINDLRRRVAKIWDDPVGEYAYKSVPSLHPNDSLTRTLQALAKTQDNIAVIDPDTHVLVGIVSYWDVIDHLTNGQ